MESGTKPKSRIRRYGFELLVVFLGVWLSLLAESWRQAAIERSDEQTSLVRIAEDMVADTFDISWNIVRAEHGLEGARWVLEHRHGPPPLTEDLAENLVKMGPCSRPVWNASEYTALKGSGRLNLIGDEALRQDVVELYESRAFLEWVHEQDCAESEAVLDLMAPYVEFEPDNDFESFGSDQSGWKAWRHPLIETVPEAEGLMADRLLMNRIAKLAANRQFLQLQMEGELEKTKALRQAILESTGG